MASFFDANDPPPSYSAMDVRNKIAIALMGKREPYPQNFGQGLTYVGDKIREIAMLRQMNRMEAARQRMLGGQAVDAYGRPLPALAAPIRPQASVAPTVPPSQTSVAPMTPPDRTAAVSDELRRADSPNYFDDLGMA